MKVLLTTLNAKYIQSSLALRYLEKYCKNDCYELCIQEYTINDHFDSITANIYRTYSDVIAFSCYIWNIEMILEIADRLKKVNPNITIILGGPEVSYDPEDILRTYDYIDYIVIGEGEETLNQLLMNLYAIEDKVSDIKGIAYKGKDGNVFINEPRPFICDLDKIPMPYDEADISKLRGKLIYYETSRGCPFSCSYCISSTIKGVRYFSMERIKKDLLFLIRNGVELVKFVDRTFNCNKQRTMELFEFLYENGGQTSFHCEIAADLFDTDMLGFLSKVPKGLFQFEIGVQSTNSDTLAEVDRKTDFKKLAYNVKNIREVENIHLHLDLIAGLPKEDYRSFAKSFDDVYALAPHALQLGFLKLLKGAKVRGQAEEYGYKYTKIPPYEVLTNNWLSYEEILKLKGIEDVLEKYHNSGAFNKSIEYLRKNHFTSSFEMFQSIAEYFHEEGLDQVAHSRKSLYDILYEFYDETIKKQQKIFSEYLKFDLIFNHKGVQNPYWYDAQSPKNFREICFEFLKDQTLVRQYLPGYIGVSAKQIIKQIGFEIFRFNVMDEEGQTEFNPTVILFDYINGEAYPVENFFGNDAFNFS